MSTNGGVRPVRQHSKLLWLDGLEAPASAIALEPISMSPGTKAHSEAWLQELIFRFPQLLPVSEIEPAFGSLLPVCTELLTPTGYVDNLFVTANGNLAIVECKLWRNPEARREVVAQIIDYAHGMSRWTYEDLENAVKQAERPDGGQSPGTLYELVGTAAELDEANFVDAVTRNLRLGRLLLLLVGDGIREGVESLSAWLQAHAGFHFTLGMVELTVFQAPAGGFVIQPRILARTVNIERGIVRIADVNITVEATPAATSTSSERKRTSISQDTLLESIAKEEPELPDALGLFLERAERLDVFLGSASKSLQIRWRAPNGEAWALGGITLAGELMTYNVNWGLAELGRLDLSHEYIKSLAALLECEVRKATEWHIVLPGTKSPPKAIQLLRRPDEWVALIAHYTDRLKQALADNA